MQAGPPARWLPAAEACLPVLPARPLHSQLKAMTLSPQTRSPRQQQGNKLPEPGIVSATFCNLSR